MRAGVKRGLFLLLIMMAAFFLTPVSLLAAEPSEKQETVTKSQTTEKKPSKVKNVKMDNSQYKELKVTWDRVQKADGYEVRYSRRESMKKATRVQVKGGKKMSCTITGLSRQKIYYVTVRAYRTVDGKKIYGPVSTKKHRTVKGKLIVIDPGHQSKANTGKESIGPGSSVKKMKVTAGTEGCVTKQSESSLNLKVSKTLKKELEKRGYDVKMTRTVNNVNISNAERAQKANKWGADAFIRIHANSADSSSAQGVLTISPTKKNPYPAGRIYKKCYRLSSCVLKAVCTATGAKNRGIWQTDTMTGINWCEVPVTILEMGFLSNPSEDRKLAKSSYQKKIVKGIADGLDQYFNRP